ncbi:hypothetical protein PA598K_06116 [Paenibacillus sp. 598K]|uniref:glycerophosphodiester phosphodiesterase family protein n=1 Tax=Paenibacillus sp. 598K TaxID=1117987 RepID=UPI000FFA9B8E|nr:glycerophosphodiester phosphodiesterase family protein [Paenibacillus sp. 598K]GBF77560.1 hypothetical protein PA598K_06116 [Paenibacillus sp. 598K]
MKLAKKLLPLLIAGTMMTGLLPELTPAVSAAEERAEATISRTATAPIIDGALDESMWLLDEEIGKQLSGAGADALQAKMGMMWDSKYLYIGVQSTDPYLATSPGIDQNPTGQPGDYWWDHPNVTLFIDPILHQSTPFQGKDVQIGLVYKPGTTTPYFSFGSATTHTGRDEKKILRAIRTTDTGWNLEVAIPWDFLGVDPAQGTQLGMEATVGSRYEKEDGGLETPTKVWSAYNSQSFWNDTSGYGVITLDETAPLTGSVPEVLLEEDFDGYADGETPFGWISNVSGGGKPFQVEGGRLVGDAHGSGQQSRIYAPVQWDDYAFEADVQFQSVLNSARWMSLIFRAPSAGLHPYNQMAVRQSGAYEIAYRNEQNGWNVAANGTWKPLELNKDYSLKVRVVGNTVKEYIKEADNDTYELLIERTMDSYLLERGKVGFQIDQGKMSVDRMKVTRIDAVSLDVTLPETVEGLSGPIPTDTAQVTFSDGIAEPVSAGRIKWSTSDEQVIRIVNNELVPLQEGTAEVTGTYGNVSVTRQIAVTASQTGKTITSLSHDNGYALATVDEPLALSELTFDAVYSDYSEGVVSGDELTWQVAETDAAVVDGKLIAKRSGLIRLQGQSGAASIDFLIAAKQASEQDYVLYEQDFSGIADGALPEGWRVVERSGNAAVGVKNGALELDAASSPVRVLLPEVLDRFGDYRIDATATHLRVNDAARWHSIMYRVQNANYPYYQMAVRQGATAANGVEFAERTAQNAWNVIAAQSYTSAIAADQMYDYTVRVKGNRVQQLINGDLVTHTAAAKNYSRGAVGLQANGSVMKVERIKVSLQVEELASTPEERIVTVVEPQTQISLAPTVVAAIEGQGAKLELDADQPPATAMLHVNSALQITSGRSGQTLQSLEDALKLLGDRVMPALYVHDAQTVTKLVEYLKSEGIGDAFIVSDQPELVKQARTEYPLIRGIVDFPSAGAELTPAQLMDIRRTVNSNLSKIALLPERSATPDNVEYLQGRLVTVWAKQQASGNAPSTVAQHKLITAGVNGIVTASPGTLIDALAMYDGNTTLIRKPWMIGHRGIPGLAPENTLEGAVLAYELGADIVENDIYLTKDNQIVIMHDGTLDRTTAATGAVEGNYTLAELQQILANKQFPNQYPNARIPSLEQFFKKFKDTDLIHFVEVKTYNPAIIDPLVELIQKYDVEDQVVVISFSADQIRLLNEKLPGMSQGFLTGGYANDTDVNGSIHRVLNVVQPLNSTFNSGYGGFGKAFLEASKHRGITTWPWTYRNLNDFTAAFVMGTYGLTTDYSNWATDWPNRASAKKSAYNLAIGEKAELKVDVRTYTKTLSDLDAEIVVLSGGEHIEVADGQVTAKSAGTAHVMLRYTNQTVGSPVYDLYTQPVTIEVRSGDTTGPGPGPGPVWPGPTVPTTPEPGTEPEPGAEQPGQPEQPVDGKGVIKLPVTVDEQNGRAAAALDAEQLNELLRQAVADANGTKQVRIEAKGGADASQIVISLPVGALSQSGLAHRLEVATSHGTVILPSHALTGAIADETVQLIVERRDSEAAGTASGQVGSRPVIDVRLTDASGTALTLNAAAGLRIEIPYAPIAADNGSEHTLVLYAIDESGTATIVPNARYDAASGTMRGALDRLGMYAVAQAGTPRFDDLAKHGWAQTAIETLAARQIILGLGEQAYGPAAPITRADFVTLMVRALQLGGADDANGANGANEAASDNFADVSPDAYYYESLGIAKSLGLVEGQGDGKFHPRSTITRQEMFTIVARAMTKLELLSLDASGDASAALQAYRDGAQVAGYAQSSLAGLIAAGLVEGDNGQLRPQAQASRAETAVFLDRLLARAYE